MSSHDNNGESSRTRGGGDSEQPRVEVDAEWVVHQHQQQQEINAQIMQSLHALQQSITGLAPDTSTNRLTPTSTTAAASLVEPDGIRRPKHSLSHPEKYDGTDKAAYPAFKGLLRAKLRIDAAAIGGEPERVWYAFGRLSGKASDRIFPWINNQEEASKPLRVNDLFVQMDAAFSDPQRAQRALEWINNQKQRTRPFREFLQKFEQKLLEAGGWEFSDQVRKGYLKAAINKRLRTQLVAQAEPSTYEAYVNQLRMTSDNLEEIDRMDSGQKSWGITNPTPSRGSGSADDNMDWEPSTQVNSGKAPTRGRTENSPRAKWVSQETLEKRRENGECLRCGANDHFISNCRLGSAKRPNSDGRPAYSGGSRAKTAAVTELEKAPTSYRRSHRGGKGKKKGPPSKVKELEESSGTDTDSESGNE
jgi:hypothetical protein